MWLGLLKAWWLGSEKGHLESKHSTRSKERLQASYDFALEVPGLLLHSVGPESH